MAAKKQAPEPIFLTVLTGFLGSGKTTILNWLLKDEAFSNALVIVNEFGDVGLDHFFVETVDEQMIEMSSGCLCCTIRGDLSTTLEGLLRDRDNDRIKKFDRVIIETTGLADPAPILQTLIRHPYLSQRFHLNAVITTIDCEHGVNTLERHEEAVKQVAMADHLVFTKTDLDSVDAKNSAVLEARISALNPSAEKFANKSKDLRAAFLSQNSYQPDRNNPDIDKWLNVEAHDHHHDHDHHHNDVNRHSDRISSFSFIYEGAIPARQYDLFLDLVRSQFGAQLLRYKGIVKIKEHEDKPLISHGVQHVFYPARILETWPIDDKRTRIVCITDGVEKEKIESLFKAFAGEIKTKYQTIIYESDNPLSLDRRDGLLKGDEG